ncbi:hypothetical protein F2Q69_00007425 [Brassica cretica]|uniref:Uncharacterized protein n=1 Tax=Brassica cretica TaxID=69181 RepID=A0A8S9PB97_BRACR|nr:hypothetical protein F2Q69_00007425 [Brassica cretica]
MDSCCIDVLGEPVATEPRSCLVTTLRPSRVRARSLRSDRALVRARSLRSDRALACARSLSSDRAVCVHGRYSATEFWLELGRYLRSDRAVCVLATELWLKLGRYVATEPWLELGRYIATELWLRLPYSSLPVVGSDPCLFPWTIGIWFD